MTRAEAELLYTKICNLGASPGHADFLEEGKEWIVKVDVRHAPARGALEEALRPCRVKTIDYQEDYALVMEAR